MTKVIKGPYSLLQKGYKQIVAYIEKNNFQINGPSVEIYYHDFGIESNENHFITELQVPVKKV